MLVSQAFPSNFITAGDLDGREVALTIERVADKNTVKREDGGLIDKPVVYFKETNSSGKQIALILGKTNARLIRLLHKNDMQEWAGKKVTLYPTKIEMSAAAARKSGCIILNDNGKMATVPCVRVRVRIPTE